MGAAGTETQLEISGNVEGIDDLLRETHNLLYNVVHCWSYMLFDKAYREYISDAYQELNFDHRSFYFEDGDLEQFGLTGYQKDLKMAVVSAAFSGFALSPSIPKLLSLFDKLLSVFGSLARLDSRIEKLKEILEIVKELIARD